MNIIKFQLENISVSYQGDHTGLGSIDFDLISVVSMGPHYFPLGDAARFGIYREGGDFSDIEESKGKISGWTKLISCDRPFGSGATWINFAVEKNQNEITVRALFENGRGEDPFSFVFFVKAAEIRISEKKYLKGSLASFQGNSEPLELLSGKEKITLTSHVKSPVQIIPLAGGEFFWGADFLIAYEIHELEKKYSWSFVKSD